MDGAAAPLRISKQAMETDCIAFAPESASVVKKKGHWEVVDGETRIFDAGRDQATAHQVVAVIHHYRMNRQCFIGWPDRYFSYLLARGGAPSGPMDNEKCIAFDPERLTLAKKNERWAIFSGRKRLFLFGRQEAHAQKAVAVIHRHGFEHVCRAGQGKFVFNYLRR